MNNEAMKQWIAGFLVFTLGAVCLADTPPKPSDPEKTMNDMALNYHLMHPGGDAGTADPNAAFYLDGVYHLHYILMHPYFDENRKAKHSYSFAHVTSPDMLHWTWQPTTLQHAYTGHGTFSGTGFITKEGRPAVIYHGRHTGRNQIAIAKDKSLTEWEESYPVNVKNADGSEADIPHWDPDCFRVGDTYYAISGGEKPPIFKSKDLKNWTLIGDFMRHQLPDVAIGEDISCPNFFKLGEKWMLLCISHPLGCRYYIGDWDEEAEQFVPQKHGRMNFTREGQVLYGIWRTDVFAPESVLTPDGRRVMWAWLHTVGYPIRQDTPRKDSPLRSKSIQSLPRELSLPADGILRIKPLRELESLRYDPVSLSDVTIENPITGLGGDTFPPPTGPTMQRIADLNGDAFELRITIARDQAARKLFGFRLFADEESPGLPILLRPETGTLRVGTAEAPFAVADLPEGEDVELRIFVDKYLVEVFANDRQAMVAAHLDYTGEHGLDAFSVGATTTIKKLDIWKLKPTNQGFFEAQRNRDWEPLSEPVRE